MSRKKETTQIQILGKWAVEERKGKYKVKLRASNLGFTLTPKSPARWNVSGKSSIDSSRQQIRRTITAADLLEAADEGGRLLHGIEPDVRPDRHPHYSIAQVLCDAIEKRSHGQKEQKDKLRAHARYFIEFCEGRNLRRWEDLKHSHVGEYVEYLRDDDLRRKTIQNYIHIIGFGMRHAVRDHPDYYRDFWMNYRLPEHIGQIGVYDDDDGTDALSVAEVLEFHKWLEGHRWATFLRPGVLLGGLAGLRVREIVYMTWPQVNLQDGYVIIQDEEGHRVKNKYSVRKIPLPRTPIEALSELPRTSGRVLKVEDNKTFNWDRKKSFLEALSFYYGCCLNKAIKEWKPDCGLTAKGLRRTIQSEALEACDWPVHLVDRYVGHAPTTVMGRHYFKDKKRKLYESFVEKVLPKIEEKIAEASARPQVQKSKKLHFSSPKGDEATAQIIDITGDVG